MVRGFGSAMLGRIHGRSLKQGYFKVTPLLSYVFQGPLPFNGLSFTKKYGAETKIILYMQGMGYSTTGARLIGFDFFLDTTFVADSWVFTNENASHKVFVPRWIPFPDATLGTLAISAGAHNVDIAAKANTVTDGNDRFEVWVWEVPTK